MDEKRLIVALFGVVVAAVIAFVAYRFVAALTVSVFLYYSTRKLFKYLGRLRIPKRLRAVLVISVLAVPLILLVSVALFLQGHNLPGGGFIGGVLAAAAFALWYRRGTVSSALGLCGFVIIVAITTVTSGPLAGAVVAAMTLSGLLILVLARRFGLSAAGVFATASVGLLSHPLGDLFTGEPPALLYPFDVTLVGERIALSADPTLHLLGAFAIELSIIWLALIVYYRLTDRRVRSSIDRKAALGVGYAAAAVTLPAPTLDVSYHFVFSILVFGIIGATQRGLLRRRGRGFAWLRAFATGLTAITVAAAAYLVTYVVL